MGIYWQTQKLQDGETRSFDFSGLPQDVAGYCVGLAGFQLAFEHYHRVQEAGVLLDANRSGADLVQVTAHLPLLSDTGARSSRTASWVFVTVLAWTGGDAVMLDGSPKLPDSRPTSIEELASAEAALASFRLRFDDGRGHRLSEIAASLSAYPGEEEISVSGIGEMDDGSLTGGEIELGAAVLARSTDDDIPFQVQVATSDQGATDFGRSNAQATASFSGQIAAATALLTSFDLAFDPDSPSRYLACFKAGAMGYDPVSQRYTCEAPRIDGQDAVVTTNFSMYQDSSAHHQSVSNRGTFLVIASQDPGSVIPGPPEAAPAAPIPDHQAAGPKP